MSRHAVTRIFSGFLSAAILLSATRGQAEIKLHNLFSDNMVMQQSMAAPVWGTTDKPDKVTVSLQGQDVSAMPEAGKWRVEFKPLKAGGPFTLSVKQGDAQLEVKEVLVGEVWLCGGQSNMQWSVAQADGAKEAIAAAGNDKLRLFTVPRPTAPPKTPNPNSTAQDNVDAKWQMCTPETVSDFSAVGYYFGRDLQKQLAVPVGLISSNLGGTTAERWTTTATLDADPELAAMKKPQGQSDLYNTMISPLAPFAIRGAIWYQGESNVGIAEYRKLLPAMIKDWRQAFHQGDFPFLIVQLAPFLDIRSQPGPSPWAELRDAQLNTTRTVPKTAEVVIVDLGDEHNIHPMQKQPVGERLSLAARANAYGEKVESSGPVYDKMTISGDKVLLSFTHVDGGLVVKPVPAETAKRAEIDPEKLNGFTIAGEDQMFYKADAKIEGDQVVVSSDKVAKPVAVRYGWDDYPVVNLWNKENLPATPFRTDHFTLSTDPKNAEPKK